jgi:hypothetical protein
MESGGQEVLGRDDVDSFHSRQPRQQIVVSGPQPLSVRGLIRDSDDDVTEGGRIARPYRERPERVLVQCAARGNTSLEFLEGGGQKTCLAHHAFRATIYLDAAGEAFGHEPIEVADGTVAAAELVVKREDLDNQSRPETEWCRGPRTGYEPRRSSEQHLALEFGKHRRSGGQALVQSAVEIRAGEYFRKNECWKRALLETQRFERPAQGFSGATTRNEHRHVPGVQRIQGCRTRFYGAMHRAKIGDAQQPGDAWGNHEGGAASF